MKTQFALVRFGIFSLFLLVLCGGVLVADLPQSFEELVDFEMSLSSLSQTAQENPEALFHDPRIILLDGVIASATVLDDNPETYFVQLEMVDGRWHGTSRIDVFRVYVLLEGPEYAEYFPARPSPDASDRVVGRNARVLIVAQVIDLFEDEIGGRYPVLEGFRLRVIR